MYYIFEESARLTQEKIVAVRHQVTDEDLRILFGRSIGNDTPIHPEDCPYNAHDFLEMLAKAFTDQLITRSPQEALDNLCDYIETH
jgi:hypothetical protein